MKKLFTNKEFIKCLFSIIALCITILFWIIVISAFLIGLAN